MGQVGAFEYLPVNAKLKRIIARGASEEEIWAEARAGGMRTLFEDALDKVNQGITTLEEALIKVPNIRKLEKDRADTPRDLKV